MTMSHSALSTRQMTSLANKASNDLLREIAKGHMSINQMDYYANVSKKHKYVFMENPKVASTSILKLLQEREDSHRALEMQNPHERHESPVPKLSDFNPDEQGEFFTSDEYFRFAFVRNPLTRILSAYLSKIEKSLRPKAEILAIIKGVKANEVEDLHEEVCFGTFVDVVCSQKSEHMNCHWKAQVDQIMYDGIDYTYIGRFESLTRDFEYVVEKLFPNRPVTLGQSRNKTSSNSKFDCYYTKDLIDKVYNKYYEDFQVFEYTKLPLN